MKRKCIGEENAEKFQQVILQYARCDEDRITFVRNKQVTLLIRSKLSGDLKLGNKMNLFDYIDTGRIKVMYRTRIKEFHECEVVLMDRNGKELARLENGYIFGLIGGDRPTNFLKDISITIVGKAESDGK